MKRSKYYLSAQITMVISILLTATCFSQVVQAACNECGTVTDVKIIKIEGQGSGVGAVTGGVLGGVVGHGATCCGCDPVKRDAGRGDGAGGQPRHGAGRRNRCTGADAGRDGTRTGAIDRRNLEFIDRVRAQADHGIGGAGDGRARGDPGAAAAAAVLRGVTRRRTAARGWRPAE